MSITDKNLYFEIQDCSLLTDLYQLTMSACYVGQAIAHNRASFELFCRKLPKDFGYLIAMGLEQVLSYLQQLKFSPEQIQALQDTGLFKAAPYEFWNLLEKAKFEGDVWAVVEGTAIGAYEPILRIEGPLWQAQIVESYVLNTINYQTMIATKAARLRDTAGDEAILLEFGTRRAFSPQGALWAARAAIAGGMNTTSNVLAALKLGILPQGTMAHSLIMAFEALGKKEQEVFAAFNSYFPESVMLIDTIDVLAAARQIAQSQLKISGVRIDSGDLVQLSRQVREILPEVKIIVSGDLDEWEIAKLKSNNCPIDGYGIGTKLVSPQQQIVNGVYKLVEIEGIPTAKHSENKMNYPGRKQIFRSAKGDRLALFDERALPGEYPLLELVMKNGERLSKEDSLEQIKDKTAQSVKQLSLETRRISQPIPISLEISVALEKLKNQVLNEKCSI